MADPPEPSINVVIAGGGVAGLETLLALRDLLGERVDATLITPEPHFVYRPMAVAEPFGRGRAKRHGLAGIAEQLGARLVPDRLAFVDVAGRAAVTAGGERLGYDALVVAVGAASEPVYRRALTWTPETDADIYGGLLSDIERGFSRRVAFVIPDGVFWPLPGYELALMTAWDVAAMGQHDTDIAVFTHERAPLDIFGPQASEALARDLTEAGIAVHRGVHVTESADGLHADGVDDLSERRVVALPRAVGCPPEGLPIDDRGFIPTDAFGRVSGADAVWAAGDAVAFPIKQGGLAAQQADVVARGIAAAAGAPVEPEPFRPVLRGVLLTGRGRAWMRHDLAADDAEGTAERRALFWPPTKIAGRYLSPYLEALADPERAATEDRPSGEPVDLDLEGLSR